MASGYQRLRAGAGGAPPGNSPRRKRRPERVALWLGGVTIAVGLGALAVLSQGESTAPPAEARDSDEKTSPASDPACSPRRSRSARAARTGVRRASVAPMPTGPRTLEDLLVQARSSAPDDSAAGHDGAATPAPSETLGAALGAARAAMAQRDLVAARRHLESAMVAGGNQADRDRVAGAERLLESLEQFWKAVRAESAALPGSRELKIGNDYVFVVESTDRSMTVRADGKTRVWLIEELPRELILLLYERRLGRTSPLAHLHLGSFLALDKEGDPQAAREHWRQAGQSGDRLREAWELVQP